MLISPFSSQLLLITRRDNRIMYVTKRTLKFFGKSLGCASEVVSTPHGPKVMILHYLTFFSLLIKFTSVYLGLPTDSVEFECNSPLLKQDFLTMVYGRTDKNTQALRDFCADLISRWASLFPPGICDLKWYGNLSDKWDTIWSSLWSFIFIWKPPILLPRLPFFDFRPAYAPVVTLVAAIATYGSTSDGIRETTTSVINDHFTRFWRIYSSSCSRFCQPRSRPCEKSHESDRRTWQVLISLDNFLFTVLSRLCACCTYSSHLLLTVTVNVRSPSTLTITTHWAYSDHITFLSWTPQFTPLLVSITSVPVGEV